MKAFNWSLRDIDETSVDSLLPFIRRLTGGKTGSAGRVTCDQVGWL